MLHFAAVTVSWEWVKPQKDIISDKNITNEEKAEKISKVIPEALDNYLRFYAVRLIKSNSTQEQKLLVLLHYLGINYFCVTHRVHFFLPHRVQLLF